MRRRNFLGVMLGAIAGAAFARLPEIPSPAASVQLMGYRGYMFMEAGFVHVPYNPYQEFPPPPDGHMYAPPLIPLKAGTMLEWEKPFYRMYTPLEMVEWPIRDSR